MLFAATRQVASTVRVGPEAQLATLTVSAMLAVPRCVSLCYSLYLKALSYA